MKKILLSIIIPVYNVERYIVKCIESILYELDDCVEVIIVDDCTKDNSIKICEDLIGNHNNIRIIKRQENGGLSEARNTGIEIAKGKYCWFIDSDDYIMPESIKKIINLLKKSDYDLIIFNHLRLDETGKEIYRSKLKEEKIEIDTLDDKIKFICKYLKNDYGFEVWGKIFSLEIIKNKQIKFEPNKEIFAEDICFLLYYINHCKNISIKSDEYYCYLIRESSIMGQKKTLKIDEMINLSYKVYMNIPEQRIRDCIDLVMFRLLQIELNNTDKNTALSYIDKISNKDFALRIVSNPFINMRLRIKLFGNKIGIHQILIAKRIKHALKNNKVRYNIYSKLCKLIEGNKLIEI